MRILIVEDSDTIRHMLETLLHAGGHVVEGVASGPKGVESALAATPDVILLDLHLRGNYDGWEVCAKLRATESTRAVPIIIISAMTDDASKQRALEAGATAYYTKPFSPTALLKEIESLSARESTRLRLKCREVLLRALGAGGHDGLALGLRDAELVAELHEEVDLLGSLGPVRERKDDGVREEHFLLLVRGAVGVEEGVEHFPFALLEDAVGPGYGDESADDGEILVVHGGEDKLLRADAGDP
jgi:CheY-like chemotaxis protein